jgi:hypothetical protein
VDDCLCLSLEQTHLDFLLQFKGKLSFYFLLSHLQHFSDWPYTFMLRVSPNISFSVCIVSCGSCDIFEKCSQPEYAGIEMIRMPHVHSNISITAKLGVINNQFYRFLRFCSCKKFFVFQMVSLIVL